MELMKLLEKNITLLDSTLQDSTHQDVERIFTPQDTQISILQGTLTSTPQELERTYTRQEVEMTFTLQGLGMISTHQEVERIFIHQEELVIFTPPDQELRSFTLPGTGKNHTLADQEMNFIPQGPEETNITTPRSPRSSSD